MVVSALLAWEVVGLLEVETYPDWLEVYYGPLVIGWVDTRKFTFLPTSKPIPRELTTSCVDLSSAARISLRQQGNSSPFPVSPRGKSGAGMGPPSRKQAGRLL
jgi:hypothetical protein